MQTKRSFVQTVNACASPIKLSTTSTQLPLHTLTRGCQCTHAVNRDSRLPTSLQLALAFSKTLRLAPEPFDDGTTRWEIRPRTCVNSMTCVQTSVALCTSNILRVEHASTRVERATQFAPSPVPQKKFFAIDMRLRILGGGLKFKSSRNHLLPDGTCATMFDESDLPMLRLMCGTSSSNSIQKCASVKTSPHTQSHGRLGLVDATSLQTWLVHALLHPMNSLHICLVNLEQTYRLIMFAYMSKRPNSTAFHEIKAVRTNEGPAPTIDVRKTCDLYWNSN